jgi:hypothetical protein
MTAAESEWNCQFVQLTSDKTRTDAHRFYERCGFVRLMGDSSLT